MKHGKKASKGHAKGSKEALNSKAGAESGKKVAPKSDKKAVASPPAVKGKAEIQPKRADKTPDKAVAKAPAKGVAKAVAVAEVKGGKAVASAVATRSAGAGAKAAPSGGKADSRGKAATDSGGLRPDIAAAFQRVLKKFPDALRRLAD